MSYFPEIEIKSSLTNKNAIVTPMKELRVGQSIRLVGAAFQGDDFDVNFWRKDVAGTSGTAVVSSGQLVMSTGDLANGYSQVISKFPGRYISGQPMYFRAVIRVSDTGTLNNERIWGLGGSSNFDDPYDMYDQAVFVLNGTTFSVRTVKEDVENNITTFNGDIGTTYSLDTNVHTYEIWYTNSSVWFIIDDVLLHKYTAQTDTWTDTLNFNVLLQDENSSGLAHPVYLYCRVASVNRIGHPQGSSPMYYHVANGAGENSLIKYGTGTLHRIILNQSGAGGATVTLYDHDSVDASRVIAIIEASGNPGTLTYGLDFHQALYVVATADCGDMTIVYD